jgi:hypothetical protein
MKNRITANDKIFLRREKQRKYREDNRDRIRAQQAEWRDLHSIEIAEYDKKRNEMGKRKQDFLRTLEPEQLLKIVGYR